MLNTFCWMNAVSRPVRSVTCSFFPHEKKFALDVVFVGTGFIKHGKAIYPRKDFLFDA